MANRNALLEILADEFSSEAQKDAAQAGLYRLDNPERIVTVDLTEPTAVAPVAPVAPAAKFTSYVPAHRIGLIVSGIDYTDPAAGYPAADAAARLRCPEFDGEQYRAAQRQWSSDACACTRANQQDSDNRMAIIQAAHPTWDSIQVHKEYATQDESHTKFVIVNGTVEKRRYDNKWTLFTVVPVAIAPSEIPVPVAVVEVTPAPIPMRELSEEQKLLLAEAPRDLDTRQAEREARAMREAMRDVANSGSARL